MTREYKVEVERDGRWWMVRVPEIDGLTQARRISEINDMARSLIAISTDAAAEDIVVRVHTITVPGIGDIAATADQVRDLRSEAVAMEGRATQESSAFARQLTDAGVPVRDTSELLGVSPQRVSQLANA